MQDIIKICNKHGPLTKNEIYKNKVCKKCQYQWTMKYESKTKERKDYWREYRRKKKETHNLVKFNITADIYDAMKKSQDNKCMICKNPESIIDNRSKKIRKLSVDHCHITNKIRGLLCGRCNSGIGLLNHSTYILKNAIDYLTD